MVTCTVFKFEIKYGKELQCLNTKGKYSKVTNTEIKWLIISKSVTIFIFVEFIDQLIDYPINCASLRKKALMPYVNVESSDERVHLCSLIWTFSVCQHKLQYPLIL